MLLVTILAAFIVLANAERKKIIIDTDIFSAVDDVGALAVANVFHNSGDAEIVGVVVNTPSKWGPLAVSAINTYYGNGGIPVAAIKPVTEDTFFDDAFFSRGEYASKLAYHFPRVLQDVLRTPNPVDLYRQILGEAQNGSITIVSIGFFNNLAALLDSEPDTHSSLTGRELITTRVKDLVIMGGDYPSGKEYNFAAVSPLLTSHVVNNWPGSMTFSGASLGGNITSGSRLSNSPDTSPIRAAYRWNTGCDTMGGSWDQVTILYAVTGLGDTFRFGNRYGYNRVHRDGSNSWVLDPKVTNQKWIELADGVSNTTVAATLDDFYSVLPSARVVSVQSRPEGFGSREMGSVFRIPTRWPSITM